MSLFFRLCKMELKYSWRVFMPFYVVLISCSVFNSIRTFLKEASTRSFFDSFNIILSVLFMFGITSLLMVVIVSIVRNFSKSMFGREAYLTQTLPVSSTQLVLSKLAAAVFWMIVSFIVIEVSANVFWYANSPYTKGVINISFRDSMFGAWGTNMLEGIFIWMFSILQLFFVTTIVHTCYFHKHRFVSGVIIYFLIKYMETFVSHFLSNVSFLSGYVFQGILVIVLIGLYLFATCYLLDHKLEVE